MNDTNRISDEALEERLLSLAEKKEETASQRPPVINTFLLRMEAERRRSRRQAQIMTIAVWFSVTATLAILAYLTLMLWPELQKEFPPAARQMLAELKRSLAAYGRVIDALGIAMLLDSLFSAALLIAGRNRLFTQSD